MLGRLLKLNHERCAEEVKQGLHDKKGKAKKPVAGRKRRSAQPASAPGLFPDDQEDDDPPQESEPVAQAEPEQVEAVTEADGRPANIDDLDTDAVMAAFRQASRGRGSLDRDELLKEVSQQLGYQRLGSKVQEALRGHLRAAIRRKIIEADGPQVRPGCKKMEEYPLEDLRETICSVMRPGKTYDRDEVIQSVARYLGFVRVKETVLAPIKSAINSAIRQGLLGYEGNAIWRKP